MKVLRLKKLSWSRKCTVLFNTLLKPFLILAVKCSLQNTPYFSFSPFEHWQVDNRNVLDSQSAAGDDIWEGEWAALFLHDRFPLQDQKAGLNSLLKGPGQENHLRESTAHYSAHQQKPVFFLFVLEEEEWLLHTALCLQVCICSGPKWHQHKLCQVCFYELSEHGQFFGEITTFQSQVSLSKFACFFSKKSLLEFLWAGPSF